jgi:L-idonate 5-dehydrogenase
MIAGVLYGEKDLRLEDRPLPQAGPGQVVIRVARAGICGSDIHYFQHGYCGAFIPTGPFILGHEFVGTIVEAGEGVTTPAIGQRVTVNPARPCGRCEACLLGRGNICPHTIMLGSGSTDPPTDGAFAGRIAVAADQCYAVPDEIDDGEATMIEPLSVALHALKVAPSVAGKRVLIIGGGPIGLLVVMAARAFGAASIALSDLLGTRREWAIKCGADVAFDPSAADFAAAVEKTTGGGFDVIFEASGAAPAVRQAFDVVRRGGTIVQIGTIAGNLVHLPANDVMVKELSYIGSFRYASEFPTAIRLLQAGRIDVKPLISQVLPIEQLVEALELALTPGDVLKVQVEGIPANNTVRVH